MRHISGKYQTDADGDIVKTDGTPIPEEEPLMLFRGQDRLVPDVIDYYADMCAAAGSPEEHVRALKEKAENMRNWQNENPDTVKVPD